MSPAEGEPAPPETDAHDDQDADRKAFESLRAACAFRGFTLARSNPADGPVTYWAGRWNLTTELKTLPDVARFVQRIGGQQA